MKVDFHCHTYHSADSINSIQGIIQAARQRGLDKLVVTDHNTIAGALEAYKAAPDLIIVGEEILTTEGEFLAAFVTDPLPKGLQPLEALERLKKQNAFICVSHPFDYRRCGWPIKTLELIAPELDAIEVLNARVMKPDFNPQAQQFADSHHLPGTAGSDGHHPSEIGRVYSDLPEFTDTDSLRTAIKQATQCGRISSPLVHLWSLRARMKKAFNQDTLFYE